jgi:glutamate-1-semialdehyde aminotransferase
MVRFFLSGSEATSAAVRIARAYTGRNKIIKWGYHGWHDWTTIGRKGPTEGMSAYLNMLHCPVESITCVPDYVSQNTIEMKYDDLDSLKKIMKEEGADVACVIMEPFYFDIPHEGYLEGVKKLLHKYNSVFILDEVKTGARISEGGAQEYLNIIPDLSVFSKAISNGYSFSLVAGKREIMSVCEELWFAGTNSGNTVGITAALATMREAKKVHASEKIWDLGERMVHGIRGLIDIYGIDAEIGSLPPMPYLTFKHDNRDIKRRITTRYLSSLIQKGIFMPLEHCFFISYSHSMDDIDTTLNCIEDSFKLIKKEEY